MNTNEYREPTLRDLLDDSREAVERPGRYCDRMAYIMDVMCDPTGDEEVSCGMGGMYTIRYGRRALVVGEQGFVASQRFKNAAAAKDAFEAMRRAYGGGEDS